MTSSDFAPNHDTGEQWDRDGDGNASLDDAEEEEGSAHELA